MIIYLIQQFIIERLNLVLNNTYELDKCYYKQREVYKIREFRDKYNYILFIVRKNNVNKKKISMRAAAYISAVSVR